MPTGTPTRAGGRRLIFSLDAVRVSQVNNPGNLRGLAAVKRGSKVWLMMYYTLKSVPKKLTRVAAYTVESSGKRLWYRAFRETIRPGNTGRYSRYIGYFVPRSLPYGAHYAYRATLRIGKRTLSKSWKFSVAHQEKLASSQH